MVEKHHMTPRTLGLLVLLALVWGGSFFFVELALTGMPVLSIVAARVGIAAAVLLGVCALRGVPAAGPRGAVVAAYVGMGFLNNAVPFTLIVWGQTVLGAGLAAILNATMPLMTVLVAHAATRDERVTKGRLLAVVVGFAGVAVMLGGTGQSGGSTDAGATPVLPMLACLAAAAAYAAGSVFGRRFARLGVAPLAAATGQLSASALMLLPLAVLVDRPWTLPMPGGTAILGVLGLAIVSTALAYVLYFEILARAGATNLSTVTFLIPMAAMTLGVCFLDEVLLGHHLAGFGLILCGLVILDGRGWAWLSRQVPRR